MYTKIVIEKPRELIELCQDHELEINIQDRGIGIESKDNIVYDAGGIKKDDLLAFLLTKSNIRVKQDETWLK